MQLRALLGALIMGFTLWTGSALAQESAQEMFRRGEGAYSVGNYELAIQEWDRAYAADPRPRIQYNLAQAYERIGKWPEALAALRIYLENADPDADANYADATARYSSLQQRLSQTGLVLEGGLDGGTIRVDGKVWGMTPRPDKIPVDPGAHQIEIAWEERQSFQASIVVPPGQVIHLTVVTPPEGQAASEGPAGEPLPPAATQPHDGRLSRGLFIGAGAAGAMTIASLAYLINRNNEVKDCGESVACTPADVKLIADEAGVLVGTVFNDQVSRQADVDQVEKQRMFGIVGTSVFGAAMVGLAIGGLLTRDKRGAADTRATRCSLGLTGGMCQVRF